MTDAIREILADAARQLEAAAARAAEGFSRCAEQEVMRDPRGRSVPLAGLSVRDALAEAERWHEEGRGYGDLARFWGRVADRVRELDGAAEEARDLAREAVAAIAEGRVWDAWDLAQEARDRAEAIRPTFYWRLYAESVWGVLLGLPPRLWDALDTTVNETPAGQMRRTGLRNAAPYVLRSASGCCWVSEEKAKGLLEAG